MDDHQDRGGKVVGELAQEASQGLQRARRPADHDDVSILHGPYLVGETTAASGPRTIANLVVRKRHRAQSTRVDEL